VTGATFGVSGAATRLEQSVSYPRFSPPTPGSWGALIVAAIVMVRYLGHGGSTDYPPEPPATSPQPPTAEEILAERFARGEINADEYRERLDVLRHGDGQQES